MYESIALGSRKTYESGWKSWSTFCELMGIDAYLQRPAPDFEPSNRFFTYEVAVTHAYMLWAFNDRKLAASTIETYLSGLAFHLKCANINSDFLNSFPVARAKCAFNIQCRQRVAVSERGSLPISMEMVVRYFTLYNQEIAKRQAIYGALLIAFCLLLRISEYIKVAYSDHHLRAKSVSYRVGDRDILSTEITEDDRELLTGVTIIIQSGKSDQDGAGHVYYFPVTSEVPTCQCLCTILFNWSIRAQSLLEDPFFSYRRPNCYWVLTSADISEAVKDLAICFGFTKLHRFSSHSLRYGGASTLAAAGLPDAWIQTFGRWKSLAFLQYIKLSNKIFTRVQSTLCNLSMLRIQDIMRLHRH